MSLIQKYFWGNVFWRSANCERAFCHNFGETKINHLEVPVIAYHYIFRFKISIHYLFAMQVFEDAYYLSPIELSLLQVEVLY